MRLRAFWVLFLLLGGAVSALAVDAPVEQKMEDSTVRVIAKLQDGFSMGSGFLIGDGSYVVTNHHVIDNASAILIAAKSMRRAVTRIVIDSPEKDLAVLQMEPGISRPAATLALRSGVRKTEDVWAAGFPGAADEQAETADMLEVKLVRGNISAFVKSPSGEALYQISAPLNPGNSGGPLFDECGRVIGINAEKSLTEAYVPGSDGNPVLKRVPLGEGIAWSIQSDELVDLLEASNLQAQVEKGPCVPGSTPQTTQPPISATIPPVSTPQPADQELDPGKVRQIMVPAVVIGVLVVAAIIVTIVVVVVRSQKQSVSPPLPHHIPSPEPGVLAEPDPRAPGGTMRARLPDETTPHQIRGLAGTFFNMVFPLSQGTITMGRNPQVAQIVFEESDRLVSKRHCTVRVDRQTGGVLLEDCNSLNGTFLENGEKLRGGEPRLLRPGGKFYLGNRSNLFQVE